MRPIDADEAKKQINLSNLCGGCNGKLTACELPLKYYGKTWLAYGREPEGGAG